MESIHKVIKIIKFLTILYNNNYTQYREIIYSKRNTERHQCVTWIMKCITHAKQSKQ